MVHTNEDECTQTLYTTLTCCVQLTFPAVKVNMGRKIMPSLASGTFAQTAAKTAITAPDYKLYEKRG